MTWQEHLTAGGDAAGQLFDDAFLNRWSARAWEPFPNDREAAARLHMQLISRISTQPLGYFDGMEKTALDSIHALFEKTRAICDDFPDAQHFETLAWHVLNTHVRKFTAKWHRASEHGGLTALDTTDDFRSELKELQKKLGYFEVVLAQLRDKDQPPPAPAGADDGQAKKIENEMAAELPWGIPHPQGGVDPETAGKINAAEKKAINARREHYGGTLVGKVHACGLALSGGGIRSATFSLGVVIALARRGILPQFDYLSTVSGGGYLGSFLSVFLNTPEPKTPDSTGEAAPMPAPGPGIGLRPKEYPFRRDEGEAEALRHIRHHSKYLATGPLWERIKMVCAQLYGMVLNFAGLLFLASAFVLLELGLRRLPFLHPLWRPAVLIVAVGLAGAALLAPLLLRRPGKAQTYADPLLAIPALLLLALLAWKGLGYFHYWTSLALDPARKTWVLNDKILLAVTGAIPVIASAFGGLFGRLLQRAGIILMVLASIAAPIFFFGMYLWIYHWAADGPIAFCLPCAVVSRSFLLGALVGLGAVVYFFLLNINFTSPHRHYRNKLAEAYLIQPRVPPARHEYVKRAVHWLRRLREARPSPFRNAVFLRLSDLGAPPARGPYQLINGALNVPTSLDPAMQGRLTDFFLFSPAYCGSPLTGYQPTAEWEKKDPHLDIGTAMAISGAAAAPQMGLGTITPLRFWLALLNIRLGYWVRNPQKKAVHFGGTPGLWFLLKEMLGWMNERSPWLNVSDGGHIENLGVYELLRRRCKFIVAVDGEQDARMTFAGLTTLQRLAAIDLGVRIHINLDDLRLNEKGLSRSHFRFCRIEYPGNVHGYLLYLKLSLTGNEGEFLRRYRMDEPAFPHHSTADQFFTEAQFEAYRSLGEHVGDKLFLRAIVEELGSSDSVTIEEWFARLGKCLLEPLP